MLQTRLYLRIAFLKFDGGQLIDGQAPQAPIELTLSPWPSAAEERLALFVGSADLTTLFERTGEGLVVRADGYSLPSGENELKRFS